ncbi:phosphoheptose isomerase [candidate division WOR-3 bacterium]|uniref:Phosphoheptose isomerase n=1 Tax=candidate division WOR-3 bacterium TaxID=2052148 RepID=A0A660SK76_UNCW3|nr:MAG: phosphoheptose isomerase [candidate division WOR-3 bacterium]
MEDGIIEKKIKTAIKESMELKVKILSDMNLVRCIKEVALLIYEVLKRGGKILLCGNGGSAADAQHIAAELSGKFYYDRKPLYAEALHVNTSYLTATANDYSYEDVFSRLIEARGRAGDILIAISTSGCSRNIIKAIETANRMGLITIGFSGSSGGEMKGRCRYLLAIPSDDTPRIQEGHILIGHIICEIVEEKFIRDEATSHIS